MARYRLGRDSNGAYLEDTWSDQKPLRVSFGSGGFLRRLSQAGRRSELVARAVNAGPGLRVLDCTAGLGTDSFLLAWLGCRVTMLERSATMARLLQEALDDARLSPRLEETVQRIRLCRVDARDFLARLPERYDVAYLDPMFPARKSSAAVRGEMQMLQRFLGTDQDAADLLRGALESRLPRVVVKRPARSHWDAPAVPTHVYSNRNARYEVFLW